MEIVARDTTKKLVTNLLSLFPQPVVRRLLTRDARAVQISQDNQITVYTKALRNRIAPSTAYGASPVTLTKDGGSSFQITPAFWRLAAMLGVNDAKYFASLTNETDLSKLPSSQLEQIYKIISENLENFVSSTENAKNYSLLSLLSSGKAKYFAASGNEEGLDYNITTMSAVSASWATASTDILGDIADSVVTFRNNADKVSPTVAVYDTSILPYFLKNDDWRAAMLATEAGARALAGLDTSVFQGAIEGLEPFRFHGMLWVPADSALVNPSGTDVTAFDPAYITFTRPNIGNEYNIQWQPVADLETPDGSPVTSVHKYDGPPQEYKQYFAASGVWRVTYPQLIQRRKVIV